MDRRHVPLAQHRIDQPLAALQIPDLTALKIWLQVEFLRRDPAHDRLDLRIGLLELHLPPSRSGLSAAPRMAEAALPPYLLDRHLLRRMILSKRVSSHPATTPSAPGGTMRLDRERVSRLAGLR